MPTIAEQIQELYIGLLGRAGEKAGVDYWTEQINQNNITIEGVRENTVKFQPEYQQGLGALSRGDALNVLYNRMFQRPPDGDGFIYWAQGGGKDVPFDKLILALSNGAKENDRTTLNNKTEAAQFYTDNVPVDSYTAAGSTSAVNTVDNTRASVDASKARTLSLIDAKGETYTLTPVAESINGTLKDDTFLAAASDIASINDTFNPGDTIDGTTGTDALNLTVSGTNNSHTLAAADVKNIEVINLRAVLSDATATTTLQAINFAGAREFYADRSTSAIAFSGLTEGQVVGIKSNGSLVNGDLTVNYTDAVNSSVINISGGTQQSAISQTGTGITSTTLNSSGATANSLSGITLTGNANKTLNINAEAGLSTGNISGFSANNSAIIISGTAANSSLDGANAIQLAKLDNKVTTLDASGLSAGGIKVELNSKTDLKVTGGAGNDHIVTDAVLTSGSVNAGGGTRDLLEIKHSSHLDSANTGAKYSNFETLRVSDGVNINMDHISGINQLEIHDTYNEPANSTGDITGFSNLSAAQASAITVKQADGRMSFSVKGAQNQGQLDTLSLTFDNGNGVVKEDIQSSYSTISAPSVEAFNIIAKDNVRIIDTEEMADWTEINISGSGNVLLYTVKQSINENATIISTTTGDVIFDGVSSKGEKINITTGSGDDWARMAIIDRADVINTGAGDDNIYANGQGLNAFSDTITTGAGSDTVNITMSTDNDSALSSIDHITDLDFGGASSTVDSLTFAGIGSQTTKSLAIPASSDQATIDAQASLNDALNYLLTNYIPFKGNVCLFEYKTEQYVLANGDNNIAFQGESDFLVKVTGVSGTFDVGDFSFT